MHIASYSLEEYWNNGLFVVFLGFLVLLFLFFLVLVFLVFLVLVVGSVKGNSCCDFEVFTYSNGPNVGVDSAVVELHKTQR